MESEERTRVLSGQRVEPADSYAHALRRSPAQAFSLLGGLALILAGTTGFISNASFSEVDFRLFDFDDEVVHGDRYLSLFEVNGPHNLLHFGSGLFLLGVSLRESWARAGAIAFAVVYAVVTVLGFIDGSDLAGTFTVNTADNILHAALAGVALLAGLAPSRDVPARGEAGTAGVPPPEPRTAGRRRESQT